MACLEEILRAFKAGEKDVAEGWGEEKEQVQAHAVLRPARPRPQLQGHPRGQRGRDRRPRARGRAGPPRLVTAGVAILVAASGGKLMLLVGAAIAGLAFGMLVNAFLMGRNKRK